MSAQSGMEKVITEVAVKSYQNEKRSLLVPVPVLRLFPALFFFLSALRALAHRFCLMKREKVTMNNPPPLEPRPLVRSSDVVDEHSNHQYAWEGEENLQMSSGPIPPPIPSPTRDSFQDESAELGVEGPDFSAIAPISRPSRLSDRTISTTVRLRRQGFTVSRRSGNFAVRSIRRDSDDWRGVIQPFVADLAFRSLVSRRYQGEVSFRPYTCHAAVLFIDLSSYSKITAAIADRGAHVLSSIANAYFSRILKIVRDYGGDVVKFAGDAVLVVWEGSEHDLPMNVLCAARCATKIQEDAGSHPVEGTVLEFRVHIGICCGFLESEIFEAPTHSNMQRLYHSVGGESLYEISDLVDLAKAGEICISGLAMEHLGSRASYSDTSVVDTSLPDAKLLKELELDASTLDLMDGHIEKTLADRMLRRNKEIEEDFIHPTVLRLLSHGGRSPTQISQMRNLCVLFIAMTSSGSSVNWLMEVQGVLDRNRCPIVQIIDDDKGVHIVAAVNLYETVPESSLCALKACSTLLERQVGCAVGVAMGPTYCGVTGSSAVACRWDITGKTAVRAARLMQYALAEELEVAVDESVYNDTRASVLLEVQENRVEIKGSDEPVTVYTLSDSTVQCALNILETVHAHVHDETVAKIQSWISNPTRSRSAVVVTGMSLSGKKIVCQRAAGYADYVPFLHLSDEHGGLLQLARTVATWFTFSEVDDVRYLANSILEHLLKDHWSRAHDECLELISLSIQNGLRSCFLVDRVQFLDEFSISLIRESLHGRGRRHRRNSSKNFSESSRNGEEDECTSPLQGRVSFLCVHVPLYQWKTSANVVEDLKRGSKGVEIPIFEILEAKKDELRTMFRDLSDMEVEDRWLDAYAESAGYCAGYFIERAAASRNLSGKLWSEGKQGLSETSEKLVLSIPPGRVRMSRLLHVTQVSPDVAMRFHQLYDELPPLFQTVCKILSVATRKTMYKIPRFVLWEVLNDLIAEGVEANVLSIVLNEMVEMYLLNIDSENEEDVVSFRTPALGDIALDVCIPIQFHAIATALLERLESLKHTSFHVPLLMADLLHELKLGEEEVKKQYWQLSYALLRDTTSRRSKHELNKWKELISDEIAAAGFNVGDILGSDFHLSCRKHASVGNMLPLVKIYSAPVSLGPMGHTLTVLCRNIFHEWRVFHGATKEEADSLQAATKSASDRYLKEMMIVENFLDSYGLRAPPGCLEKEHELIKKIQTPASSDEDVQAKAATMLQHIVPGVVEPRLKRLYLLVDRISTEKIPEVVINGPSAIRRAYEQLFTTDHDPASRCQTTKCTQDAAQRALMTLAVMNWKPKAIPEFLPIIHHQTVARLRNKTLKRLSHAQLIIFRHQQTVDDLKVFLVTTPLLYEAHFKGYS